ncbi:hypothetical protein [Limnohabitans sp. Jir72]|uniref:hypothetical protein n=1 Tax=Limnohabitans sp. Jir72 TaxID=1977909 RepID=UPI0018EE4D80|nr:hypothetical protein [Limnohabitans sp. Jir72]
MTQPNIIAKASAKPISGNPVCVVGCAMPLTVVFTIHSQSGPINLPYAVRVNGQILSEFKEKPKKLAVTNQGSITIPAQSGDTVALHLGSDASADWRQEQLYAVQVNDKYVKVHIREKKGLHKDEAKLASPKSSATHDEYEAVLTGDIWMRFSHRYSPDEVLPRLPAGTSAEVARAVQSIYQGLRTGLLTVQRTGPQGQAQQVSLHFPTDKSDNCYSNISGFDMLNNGLTRVHPGGYAALINAALDNGVGSVKMSSCWRPMVGSIVHRVGLGLDVNYLDAVRFNREELKTGKTPAGKQDADDNVSEDEKQFYKAWRAAKQELEVADKEEKRLSKVGTDEKKKAAVDRLKNASTAEVDAKDAWNTERNKHEPPKVKAFRKSLYTCPCVSQLFDPWYMDGNTRDAVPATPNAQLDGNEQLHAHHLHITVLDKKVLP